MTAGTKRLWGRITLRSIGAIFVGTAVVAAFVMLLSFYGSSQDNVSVITAQSLKFPENEIMLDTLSTQLAREGAALSGIEPAAGDKAREKNTNANPAPAK